MFKLIISEDEIQRVLGKLFYYSVGEGGYISNDGSIILITNRSPYNGRVMQLNSYKEGAYEAWLVVLQALNFIEEVNING